jgi:WD40 repeat protein
VIVKGCILTAAPLVVVTALAAACTTPAPSSTSTPAATPFATDLMPPMVMVKFDHAVSSLQRVSGSSMVVIGFEHGHVGLWNGRDGAAGTMLKPHDARVLAVGSSADGRELYSLAADGALARTPVTAGATPTTRKIDMGLPTTRAAAFSTDGSLLATGGEFGDIRVFDVASGALRHVLRGHRTEIQALAIGSSAPLIATASAESDLRVWDANAGKETRLIESDLSLWAVAFSPRGDLLASGGGDRRLTLRDASSFATTAESTLAAPRMVATLAWSPDGRHIALGDIDDVSLTKGGVEIVEAATPAVVARLDTGSVPATSLVVLPEGVIVAAIGSTLRSWTVAALAAK